MGFLRVLLITNACIIMNACRTLSLGGDSHVSSTNGLYDLYQNVNGKPQLSLTEHQFYFYWGLWRKLSPAELQLLTTSPAKRASLISRRNVSWNLYDCHSGDLLHQNSEEFYYLDSLQLENGDLKPIPEAVRPGWRYFSMGSFNAALAREDHNYPKLTKKTDESAREFRERQNEANRLWIQNQSRRGQRGDVILDSEHKVFGIDPKSLESSFIMLEDYRTDDRDALGGQFAKFNPSRWPVFYDERAHKPHSQEAPQVWANESASTHIIRARLVWDWCKHPGTPLIHFEIPSEELPAPGPNRPGRSDAGNVDLPIANPEN